MHLFSYFVEFYTFILIKIIFIINTKKNVFNFLSTYDWFSMVFDYLFSLVFFSVITVFNLKINTQNILMMCSNENTMGMKHLGITIT